MKYNVPWSTIALVLGFLNIAREPLVGISMFLGAFAYKSLKNRRLGLSASPRLWEALELAAIALIVALFGTQLTSEERIARLFTHPLGLIVPLVAVYVYGRFYFKLRYGGTTTPNVSVANEEGHGPPKGEEVTTRKCPFCAEDVKAEAILCRYCHKEIQPLVKG